MEILIVDDDELIRHLYCTYLSRKGFTTFQAEHGIDALEILHQHPEITTVVLDAYTPKMDAFEFLKHMQNDAEFQNKHPDIYFVSGWATQHILDKLQQHDIKMDCIKAIYLKPIDLEDFVKALRK